MEDPLANQYQTTLNELVNLKSFLMLAPANWHPGEVIKQHRLPNSDEAVSCIYWDKVFFITGTDIVRCLTYRFQAFGRTVINKKKFEEGIFSDLRNLKCDSDARLEEPKSTFLDFLYKNNCVRTQKKQKVFHWYSVGHDRLFLDALERDLKKEATDKSSSTEAFAEPALSFRYDPSQSLQDQLEDITKDYPQETVAALANVSTTSMDMQLGNQIPIPPHLHQHAIAPPMFLQSHPVYAPGPLPASGRQVEMDNPRMLPPQHDMVPFYQQQQEFIQPQQAPPAPPPPQQQQQPPQPPQQQQEPTMQASVKYELADQGTYLPMMEEPIQIKSEVVSDFPLDYIQPSYSEEYFSPIPLTNQQTGFLSQGDEGTNSNGSTSHPSYQAASYSVDDIDYFYSAGAPGQQQQLEELQHRQFNDASAPTPDYGFDDHEQQQRQQRAQPLQASTSQPMQFNTSNMSDSSSPNNPVTTPPVAMNTKSKVLRPVTKNAKISKSNYHPSTPKPELQYQHHYHQQMHKLSTSMGTTATHHDKTSFLPTPSESGSEFGAFERRYNHPTGDYLTAAGCGDTAGVTPGVMNYPVSHTHHQHHYSHHGAGSTPVDVDDWSFS